MPQMNIFDQDAFSMVSLTESYLERPFTPSRIRNMGLFVPRGVRTTTIAIEKKGVTLNLIQTSPRGSAPEQRTRNKGNMRNLNVPHLAKEAVVYADDVQNVRAFGSETELETVQNVLNDELNNVGTEIDLTEENLMLGAIRGEVRDADSSLIYNLFTEFGVTPLADFNFQLGTATTKVRNKCMELYRLIGKELQMGDMPFGVHGLCGDQFFDDLISHDSTEKAWDRWNDGAFYRDNKAYQTFFHGGIMFENYRSSDDGSVGIATDEARFFVTGVPGLFTIAYAPADTEDTVNTIGLPRYVLPSADPTGKNKYRAFELQSNPLPYCKKPRTLVRGIRA